MLVMLGLVIAAIGAITIAGAYIKWFRIGHLPGDIVYERGAMTLYVPITSMVLISLLLTGLLYLADLIRR